MRLCSRGVFLLLATVFACGPKATPQTAPTQDAARRRAPSSARRDTVVVRDPDLDRRIARLELRLMEKEAQVDELQQRLADSREEIVATMAKLRGGTSRAEAASGMAEADVALQALRAAGGSAPPELSQATRLAQQSTAEFNKENFGGALYLANQAKGLAVMGRARLTGGGRAGARPGETAFALPIRVRISGKANVREGPGSSFAVTSTIDAGSIVTAFAWTDDWIRVADDAGHGGWVFRALVTRP